MKYEPALTPAQALSIIEFGMGLFLVCIGLYMFLPWIPIVAGSTWLIASTVSPWFVTGMGALCILSGAGYIRGSIKGFRLWSRAAVWGSVGLFAIFLTMRVITIGFLPAIWLYPLTLMLIAGVLALTIRVR